jgi:hypothetical protein
MKLLKSEWLVIVLIVAAVVSLFVPSCAAPLRKKRQFALNGSLETCAMSYGSCGVTLECDGFTIHCAHGIPEITGTKGEHQQ